MKKYRIVLLVLLAAAALSFPACGNASDTAVTFSTTALDGTIVTQDFFKDHKVNFVHYWGTWCGYCVEEMPSMPALYETYKDRVGFLAIVDDATDQAAVEAAKQILADSGVTFTNVAPFGEVDDIFGNITGVPCTILVNERGEPIGGQIIGAVGAEEYARRIEAALASAH